MAKAELRIDFERGNRVFHPGENVRVEVVVSVDAPCRCDALTLTHQWRTHGKGNEDSGDSAETTLFKGEWEAKGEYRYPFEFTAARGPVTYHGHHINVDWYVNVRADIPWAIDPKAEEDFLLDWADFNGETHGGLAHAEPKTGTGTSLDAEAGSDSLQAPHSKAIMIIGLILVVVPWLISWFSFGLNRVLHDFPFDNPASLLGLLMPVLVPALMSYYGFQLLYRGFRNKAAEHKLGPTHFSIDATELRRGETLNPSFVFSPNEDLHVTAITLRLSATERAVSGSGTNKSTHSRLVYEHVQPFAEDELVTKDSSWSRTMEVTVPADAPPSFASSSNRVQWEAELIVDLPRWPDWVRRQPLRILP